MSTVEPALNSLSVSFVEQMYADYLRDAESVSPDWRNYFDELSHGAVASGSAASSSAASNGNGENGNGAARASVFQTEPSFRPSGLFSRPPLVDDNGVAAESASSPASGSPPAAAPADGTSATGANGQSPVHGVVIAAQGVPPSATVVPPIPQSSDLEPGHVLPAIVVTGPPEQQSLELSILQDRVDQLIRAYRVRGHLVADLDPLGLPRPQLPELDPRVSTASREADMDRPFSTDTIEGPQT